MKNFIYFVLTLALTLAVLFCIQIAFKPFQVFDISMEPTYKPGDFILVNRVDYVWNMPKRGDVVGLYAPESTTRLSLNPFEHQYSSQYIKRIIAVPGDVVEVKDQKVFVNGQPIDESYVMEPCEYGCAAQTIPEGHYFVLGDKRNHSDDSHRDWLPAQSDIIGKVCITYWHSDYVDIHMALVPAFFLVIVVFSNDAIVDQVKRIAGRS
jgi:signal peptidase I